MASGLGGEHIYWCAVHAERAESAETRRPRLECVAAKAEFIAVPRRRLMNRGGLPHAELIQVATGRSSGVAS